MTRLPIQFAVAAGLIGGLCLLTSARGQGTAGAARAALPTRIAVVDMAHIFRNYKKFEDLREQLEDIVDDAKATVLATLDAASGMIAFQLSEVGHDQYRKIDPFWDWLFDHFPGLLQIDEEGYYTQNEQLLEVE